MTNVLVPLRDAIDELVDVDVGVVADEESLLALHREVCRLEAVFAGAAAAFDASGAWAPSRARSAAAWLAWKARMPLPAARRIFRLGRALRSLPAAEAAWRRGDISGDHVEALASAANQSDVTRTAMVRDEADLVDAAVESRFSQFVRRLAYWRQAVDAEGSQAAEADRRAARRAHLSQSVFGLWFLDACLDPISGSIFERALRAIVDELFAAEWAATKARLGRTPTVADLPRTPAQRRADALVELATRACANPPGSRRPDPLFTVLVGWETLAGRICELSDGTVIDPSALDPWLDAAVAERVVFDSPSRVIDVGVRRRLFTGATRRAIDVRDRECFHDSCEVPADQCEGEHDKPYAAGGLTTTDNGRPGCWFHNRNRTPDDPPAA